MSQKLQNIRNISYKVLHSNFNSFLEKCFYTLNHQEKFYNNWHLYYLSEIINNIDKNNLNRLIINLPPRSLKSICFSITLPAWILGHYPYKKIICVSYSRHISRKLSNDCKKIITSNWYKKIFPHTKLIYGQNTQDKFVTTQQGFRFATSNKSSLTGEGADIIILDDPQNPYNISDHKNNEFINWYKNILVSRLNDKKKGTIILVTHRIAYNDISSYLLKNQKKLWYLASIPFIAEQDYTYKINHFKYLYAKNDILNSHRDTSESIKKLKNELGYSSFNTQFQQNPPPALGKVINFKWLSYYTNLEDIIAKSEYIIQSWDCSSKTKENNDYSVVTTWAIIENSVYLLDVQRQKLAYPELKELFIRSAKQWNPFSILIEDKSSGQTLIQEFSTNSQEFYNIIPIIPTTNKTNRLISASILIEAGKMFIPEASSWVEIYLNEVLHFPDVQHDDQIDSTSQFLNWFNQQKYGNNHQDNIEKLRIRSL